MALTLATDYATDEPSVLTMVFCVFTALVVVVGPRMVISLRAIENKSRGEGVILGGNLTTVRFGIREPPTHQSEREMLLGGHYLLYISSRTDPVPSVVSQRAGSGGFKALLRPSAVVLWVHPTLFKEPPSYSAPELR
ncbi:hypothetical protein BJ138DRAFT_1183571 [Hygrophoropsis aurantiaca]|uniref:Uncharacterized protein n=1 Tax=Hygrophoropsis aurantiaca TaxID=72124 RepID=A0ACB7ZWT1_9AGAM|nr:hypothetical protein BJ138DRAFT_1183571 [Hygrophoropsis aurantiaca]